MSALFAESGFKSRVLTDIRSEIWLKLWGNLTFNPISALTHATLVDICRFPLTRALAAAMMTEAQAIGERLGAHFRVSLERRIAGAESVGRHKTSMLQDVEVGKPLEIDGMLGAVVELAEMTGVEVPTLRAVHACVSLLGRTIVDEGIRIRGTPQVAVAPSPAGDDGRRTVRARRAGRRRPRVALSLAGDDGRRTVRARRAGRRRPRVALSPAGTTAGVAPNVRRPARRRVPGAGCERGGGDRHESA